MPMNIVITHHTNKPFLHVFCLCNAENALNHSRVVLIVIPVELRILNVCYDITYMCYDITLVIMCCDSTS